ncbi:hypothetical protein VKT23_008871 [Stygiomarasmius scandens]|uniref:Uncharacterized protein n=1 Tax=Marasmiellus scandens TaxID=2682957 RepID=A0ABR1JFS9_9AGAR
MLYEERPHPQRRSTTEIWGKETSGFLNPSPLILKSNPWSLIVLMLWAVYIIILLWLLEYAVSRAHHDLHPPWSLRVLPELLLTFFAQAHTAITSAHLARVAASAIRFRSTAPNTWRELFWTVDRAWEGPVGMISTAQKAFTRKIALSKTFYIFVGICSISLAVPGILTRAYHIETVPVIVSSSISPTTFTPERMNLISAYLQEGVSIGPWGTGLSVTNLYNSSMFLSETQTASFTRTSDTDPEDFFFAGDIGAANVTLPGMRLEGGCTPWRQYRP